ncbi:MAG: DUF3108 domain-containing protein [Bacteroidetes bacterium]|nr:DUF3108 domain-containing protein [Bacteroidota bacterium]
MVQNFFRFLFIFLFTSHCSLFNSHLSAQEIKPVNNESFTYGEKLTFTVYYDSYLTGKVTAGTGSLEVSSASVDIAGRKTYHIVGEGKSKGAFNLFFKVNDRFESWVDEEYLFPWSFKRDTHEGNYDYKDEVKFNQFSGNYSSTRANRKMPIGTHDIISAYFHARNIDFTGMKPGDTYPVNFILDDSLYLSVIKFIDREEITIELGTFHCLHFKPMVVTGAVFSQPYPMDLWITDDKNHIPILAKSAVIVGSIKMELVKYKGLKNPGNGKD